MKRHYQVFLCIAFLVIGVAIGVYFPAKYAPQTAVVISSIGSIATALTLMFLVYESFINKSERREQREMINLQRYENHLNLFKQRALSIENDYRYQGLLKFKNTELLYKIIFPDNSLSSVTISLNKNHVDDNHLFNAAEKSLKTIITDIKDVTLSEKPTINSFTSIFHNIEWLYTDLYLSMKTNSMIGNINGTFDLQSRINVYNLHFTLIVIEASLNQLKDFASFGNKTDYAYDIGIDFKCFEKKLMSSLGETIFPSRAYETASSRPLPKNAIRTLRESLQYHLNIELGHEQIWLEIELLIGLLDEKITNADRISLDGMRSTILSKDESAYNQEDFGDLIASLEQISHKVVASYTEQDNSLILINDLLTNIREYRQRNNTTQ
ncbi:hypothetical protein C1N32_04215 [Vibrio diazotrophicus]|uniref:Uncharacterized protein n=1 Tax=Vibrio diazotrophicus TaxID=685 RepID=A0A2J8I6U3_VIBDI|nr:hypothetical protein [Vibrio diazotrophicus]PNI06211.1 hypothetical protein C1N32_04215 [Vibrio diazotrophicus]